VRYALLGARASCALFAWGRKGGGGGGRKEGRRRCRYPRAMARRGP
jgi:hypothetical protein